jgi:hypothetical protein
MNIPVIEPYPLRCLTTVTHKPFAIRATPEDVVKNFVVLYHSTPSGMAIAMWLPVDARKIARSMLVHAKQAETGLILLGGDGQVPDLGDSEDES